MQLSLRLESPSCSFGTSNHPHGRNGCQNSVDFSRHPTSNRPRTVAHHGPPQASVCVSFFVESRPALQYLFVRKTVATGPTAVKMAQNRPAAFNNLRMGGRYRSRPGGACRIANWRRPQKLSARRSKTESPARRGIYNTLSVRLWEMDLSALCSRRNSRLPMRMRPSSGFFRTSGSRFAATRCPPTPDCVGLIESQNRELQIMRIVRHPNIVQLKAFYYSNGERVC